MAVQLGQPRTSDSLQFLIVHQALAVLCSFQCFVKTF